MYKRNFFFSDLCKAQCCHWLCYEWKKMPCFFCRGLSVTGKQMILFSFVFFIVFVWQIMKQINSPHLSLTESCELNKKKKKKNASEGRCSFHDLSRCGASWKLVGCIWLKKKGLRKTTAMCEAQKMDDTPTPPLVHMYRMHTDSLLFIFLRWRAIRCIRLRLWSWVSAAEERGSSMCIDLIFSTTRGDVIATWKQRLGDRCSLMHRFRFSVSLQERMRSSSCLWRGTTLLVFFNERQRSYMYNVCMIRVEHPVCGV